MSPRLLLRMDRVEPAKPLTEHGDYLPVGDFLVPASTVAAFTAAAYEPEPPGQEEILRCALEGELVIRNGVAEVYGLRIVSRFPESELMPPVQPTPITNHLLSRISVWDLAALATARLSLTRWQDRHYRVEPAPRSAEEQWAQSWVWHRMEFMWRQIDARHNGAPMPMKAPPKPVLIDPDGVPWYRVQVLSDTARDLSRLKRPRITPDFLHDALTVYRMAAEAGEPTTAAVKEWAAERTGREPSRQTVMRWIKNAKGMYEGADDAEDR